MNRILMYSALAGLVMALPALACSCWAPKPACAYLSADAIFLGRVSFTNDDGSGMFTQATLVRFDIEEAFKGVLKDASVWVDPGSFSSCYENYRLGERYLIFAWQKARMPSDSAAMGIMRDGSGRTKPFPPAFDPRKPPAIYFAPECAGSRGADYPSIQSDLAMLRAYKSGRALPRVLGNVYLSPFPGWPILSGPAMKGVQVTMRSGDGVTLRTSTDGRGAFVITAAPAGDYNVWANLPPFRMGPQRILHVPETGCGYTDIALSTTSGVSGIVLDHRGRPAAKVPVWLHATERPAREAMDWLRLYAETDASGGFRIEGVPDTNVVLAAGSDYPRTVMPYDIIYYPFTRSIEAATKLRLRPGERRDGIVLWLESPLQETRALVHVAFRQGKAAQSAYVRAFDFGGVIAEFAKADSDGIASLPCLRGVQYELEAQFLERRGRLGRGLFGRPLFVSRRTLFTCGATDGPVRLVFDAERP